MADLMGQQVAITVNNAAPQVLGSNPRRQRVWIFPSGGALTMWSFGNPAVVGTVGFIVGAGSTPILLKREDIGSLITQPLSVVSTVNGTNCAVIEASAP